MNKEVNRNLAVVVNLRDYYDRPFPDHVVIDRGTKWGNPYKAGTRKENIARYRLWLWRTIKQGKITLEELSELHGKKLGCWCSPKQCHGDVLVKAAEWAHRQLLLKEYGFNSIREVKAALNEADEERNIHAINHYEELLYQLENGMEVA